MARHFHDELKQLKQKLLEMSFMVEEQVAHACDALLSLDPDLAREVIENEKIIDSLEIEIDEKGHSLFALGQPMAVDLRLISMALKINNDLERMADHAVNIAEKCLLIIQVDRAASEPLLEKMAGCVQKMLRDSLDSFLKEDAELALDVLKRDDEVDDLNKQVYYRISGLMERNSGAVTAGVHLIMIGHNLERVADLAVNIAEDVIYLKQGKEVRHGYQMGNASSGT